MPNRVEDAARLVTLMRAELDNFVGSDIRQHALTNGLAAAERLLDGVLRDRKAQLLTIRIRLNTDPDVAASDTEDVEHALRRLIDKWQEDGRVEFAVGEAGVIYADDGNDCGGWTVTQADHQTILGGGF